MFPEIVQVVPNENYTVTFADGKIVMYDVAPLLEKEVFRPLIDKNVFVNTCTIMNDTLAWDLEADKDARKCIDIDPQTLYALPAIDDRSHQNC